MLTSITLYNTDDGGVTDNGLNIYTAPEFGFVDNPWPLNNVVERAWNWFYNSSNVHPDTGELPDGEALWVSTTLEVDVTKNVENHVVQVAINVAREYHTAWSNWSGTTKYNWLEGGTTVYTAALSSDFSITDTWDVVGDELWKSINDDNYSKGIAFSYRLLSNPNDPLGPDDSFIARGYVSLNIKTFWFPAVINNPPDVPYGTGVTLKWQNLSLPNELQYELELRKDSPTGPLVVSRKQDATSYDTPPTLTVGTYYWHVRTVDKTSSVNHSDWSDWDDFIIKPGNSPPAAPTLVAPLNGAVASVTPKLQASGFEDSDGDAHFKTRWVIATDPSLNNEVWWRDDSDSDKLSEAVPSGELDYNTVYYWGAAFSDGQQLGQYATSYFKTEVEPSAPMAPSNLSATAVSSSQINLVWNDESNNESGFRIDRKSGSGGSWAQIDTVGAGVESYSNTGLLAGTTYYYRVRAYNTAGNSGYSNEDSATTSDTVPTSPSSLTATAALSSRIDLTWDDNSNNEQGFRIERKTGLGGTWSQIDTVGASVESYSNTGLLAGTTYYYRVRAYNTAGNSGYSNEDSATTSATAAITVLQPAAGDNWITGGTQSTHMILWYFPTNGDADLELWEADSYVQDIAASQWTISHYGFYYWEVPTTLPDRSDYQIKVISSADTSVYDFSDYFSITTVAENTKPVAFIDNISPNPAQPPYDIIEFRGHGEDPDPGDSITAWEWYSNLGDQLPTTEDFDRSSFEFTVGIHQITFRVCDSYNLWSDWATATLEVFDSPPEGFLHGLPDIFPEIFEPGTQIHLDLGGFDNDERGSDIVATRLTLDGTSIANPGLGSYTFTVPTEGGYYYLAFQVQDDEGTWSPPASGYFGVDSEPVAVIDSITPNPAQRPGDIIQFRGHGEDPDSDDMIVAGEWVSNLEPEPLSYDLNFDLDLSENNLTVGTHQISFRVLSVSMANWHETWSEPAFTTLTIAETLPHFGDFDLDGDVDGRDFLAWQRGNSPSPLSTGDLADWQANYGTGPLDASLSSYAIPAPVQSTATDSALANVTSSEPALSTTSNWWIDLKPALPAPHHSRLSRKENGRLESARDQFFARLAESSRLVRRRDVDGAHPWRERIPWQHRDYDVEFGWLPEMDDDDVSAAELQLRDVFGG